MCFGQKASVFFSRKKTVKHVCRLTFCTQSEYRRPFVFFCCDDQRVRGQRSDQVCDEELREETKKKVKSSQLNIQTQTAHRAASMEEKPSHLQIQVQFSTLLYHRKTLIFLFFTSFERWRKHLDSCCQTSSKLTAVFYFHHAEHAGLEKLNLSPNVTKQDFYSPLRNSYYQK